jgi:hypothetical protein
MTMECKECDSIIHDFMRAEEGSERVRARAFDHVMHCARCEARFFNVRSLERAIRTLRESIDSELPPPRLESALRTVFQQQKRVKHRSRMAASWLAIGVAASLLLSIGVVSWQRIVVPQALPVLATPQPIRPADQSIAEVTAPTAKISKTRTHRESKSHKPQQQLAESEEFVTGFYALPYAESSARVFSGEIVRVKLQGSALPAMGFPVALNGDQAGEQITADLLVSENGLPLAIRFVR